MNAQRAIAAPLGLRPQLRDDSALGRTDGHQRGDNVTAAGENRWPYLGRNRWPLTDLLLHEHAARRFERSPEGGQDRAALCFAGWKI